jgi:hypothetical protein
MTLDLAFLLSLAMKMAITASFVVLASVTAERVSPLIGAMVATLPVSAGPAYVFLAIDHGPEFIAQSAVASLAINAATCVFALVYARMAQRHGTLASLAVALGTWAVLALLIQRAALGFAATFAMTIAVIVVCLVLSRRYRDVTMPRALRRWYDLPLRAAMVSTLIVAVVTLSPYLGPTGSGILATFPVVLVSLMLILQPRVGGKPTAAVIANTISGLAGFTLALATVHLAAVPLGPAVALSLALAISIGWNLMVLRARRRGIPI